MPRIHAKRDGEVLEEALSKSIKVKLHSLTWFEQKNLILLLQIAFI